MMRDRTALRALQIALHDHVLGRPSAIAGALREGGPIGIVQRLGIYHHAYRARLLETLQDSFEKTWAYLGDERFATAAAAFIESHPPVHRNLRWYGTYFPEWLAEKFPADLDISELALLDWNMRNAFDGVDARPVTSAQLGQLSAADWEDVAFRFAPTLGLTPLRFNTAAIWHALDRDETPPAAVALNEPKWLMIWRKDWQPHFRVIGMLEHTMLAKLQEGVGMAAACTEVEALLKDGDAANAIGAMLRGWTEEGLICALTGIGRQSEPCTGTVTCP